MPTIPTIHFVGDPPSATKISDRPAPPRRSNPFPSTGEIYTSRTNVIMLVHDNAWKINGITETTIPSSVVNLSYHHEADIRGTFIPIVLPPIASMPVLNSLGFVGLPIASLAEIEGIDAYLPHLRTVSFTNCPMLVIEDLAPFVPMSNIDQTIRRWSTMYRFTINIRGCQLRSLRCMEQFQRSVSLHVNDNTLDLAREFATIQAYNTARTRHNSSTGDISIGGNTIGGHAIRKQKSMSIYAAITYIRDWMAKYHITT